MTTPKLLIFPCEYPIKVMVRTEAGLRTRIDEVMERHMGHMDATQVSERPSAQGNFSSITYLPVARDEAQIAALFAELSQIPGVLMVL